jgi:hypothetical protein
VCGMRVWCRRWSMCAGFSTDVGRCTRVLISRSADRSTNVCTRNATKWTLTSVDGRRVDGWSRHLARESYLLSGLCLILEDLSPPAGPNPPRSPHRHARRQLETSTNGTLPGISTVHYGHPSTGSCSDTGRRAESVKLERPKSSKSAEPGGYAAVAGNGAYSRSDRPIATPIAASKPVRRRPFRAS